MPTSTRDVVRAQWAPPVPPLALGLAISRDVLFIGNAVPFDLSDALRLHGFDLRHARSLGQTRRLLCAQHFELIVSEADCGPSDMVSFLVGIRAGHVSGSGVPATTTSIPMVLLPDSAEPEIVVLDRRVDVAPRWELAAVAVKLLRGV